MAEDLIVRWTVRLAVACYALRVLADAGDFGAASSRRWVWTAGLLCYLLHVVAAFHFVHGWSHDHALVHTVQATFDTTGWKSGVGLWVNYGFSVWWTSDVIAWWSVGPDYPRRWRRTYVVVQSVFAFLLFNATAVFGPFFWRPIVAGLLIALALSWVVRVRRER